MMGVDRAFVMSCSRMEHRTYEEPQPVDPDAALAATGQLVRAGCLGFMEAGVGSPCSFCRGATPPALAHLTQARPV